MDDFPKSEPLDVGTLRGVRGGGICRFVGQVLVPVVPEAFLSYGMVSREGLDRLAAKSPREPSDCV